MDAFQTSNQNLDFQEASNEDEYEEPSATPLWKYVTKVQCEGANPKGGAGSAKFVCKFGCRSEPYTGSYSRVRAHLIEHGILKQEETDAKRVFGGNSKARKPPLATPALKMLSNAPSSMKAIDKMFNISSREEVDQKIARCLYGNGIPFHVVRSPLWADMITAINNAPKGYKSPNYEKVRTTLLDKEQTKMRQALSPLMEDWNTHGVSIVSDGWSNQKNQTLINIMAASGGRAMFINGHDVSSIDQSAQNIAELLFKAIDYVGPSNVVQVITDNASNCKSAGAIIENKAVIGEVYEQMDTMLGQIQDTLSHDQVMYKKIHNLVVERWDKMNIPLHCLAYVLVPKYYTNSWPSKHAPGGVKRTKPHFDTEVQKGYLKALDRMIPGPSEVALIRQQISDFDSNKGVFAQPQSVSDRETMPILSWWHLYGGLAPELYSLAIKVLSQSVNTSCAERCWSTYSYIHSVKRNRLNADRAEKLVFVHYNQRLLSRFREDYEASYKNWDAYPSDDNIEEDIITIEAREKPLSDDDDDDDDIDPSDDAVLSTPPTTLVPPSLTSLHQTPPTLQGNSLEQARRHVQQAQAKRARK
ncbi:uncharacterized protein LOC143853935 [Tasmannia lanceolata]|uniref:uncharacterized protein LOC143853935 n=1 Tax=Tasmannia lanceolata TaxID=3420 RepID=UPI004062806E